MERNKTATKLSLEIPEYIEGDDKKALAFEVINFIHERTAAGQNVYGRRWAGKAGKYTKAYAKEKGFSSPVDLELTGNMLSKMTYFKSKSPSGRITIGFRKGTKDERKAEGNIQGTYGQPSPIRGKARPFLDILKKDLAVIVDDFVEAEAERQQPKKKPKPKQKGFNPFAI